jgi:SAM-dependent methyltransferase
MSENAVAKHDDWETHWDQYADAASHNPAQIMRHDIVAKFLKAHSGPHAKVFDIGSGQGDLVYKLVRLLRDADFLGVELSESGVAISRRKIPDATFVVADLFQPPPALRAFTGWASYAVCSEVLEHLDDPVAFLRQARQYLAVGACLVVTVPGGPMSAFDRVIGHRQHFTRASIRSVLEQAGFSVNGISMAGFPFFNLYRLTVIARGKKLASDVSSGERGISTKLAQAMMAVFRFLFRYNIANSKFGWQVVAVASKTSP